MKTTFPVAFLFTCPALLLGDPTSDHPDGLFLNKPGTPNWTTFLRAWDPSTDVRSISLSSSTGGIQLYSGRNESAPNIGDGGIRIQGNPISLILSNTDPNQSNNASLNVWKWTEWGVGQPLLSINGQNGDSTFNHSNVSILNGTLNVGGSSVVTASTASSVLGELGFLKFDGLGAALNLVTPPTSAAWKTAYVPKGNTGTSGLLALGTGQATGNSSVALSNGSIASAMQTLAHGGGSIASGSKSIAFGSSTKATAVESIAMGAYAEAGIPGELSSLSQHSIAIGRSSKAHAEYSVALGSYSEAKGTFSASLNGGQSRGKFSLSAMVGYAEGDSSIALGGWSSKAGVVQAPGPNKSLGHCSVSIGGVKNVPSGYGSYAFGFFNTPNAAASVSIGTASIGGGNSNQWIESDPLFEVGNTAVDIQNLSEPTTGRSNAITALKNGQTTLTNKAWKNRDTATISATSDPSAEVTDADGNALVVDGHTVLNGKVVISVPQGDISMGIYN